MLFLIAIVVPIKITFKLSYNLYSNRGVLSFKILGLRARIFSFRFKNATIQIKRRGKKDKKELELKIEKEELIYTKRLVAQFRDKLKIRQLDFAARVGVEDAFKTAMACGFVNILVVNLFIFIKNFKQTTGVKVKTTPLYNKQQFKFRADAIVSINIFDLVFCFLFALINTRRSIYHEEKVQQLKLSRRPARHQHSKN